MDPFISYMIKEAQEAQPAFKPDPDVQHFLGYGVPAKIEDLKPVLSEKPVMGIRLPDPVATAKATGEFYDTKTKDYIAGLNPIRGYQYTRALSSAASDPDFFKKYNIDESSIQGLALKANLEKIKKANEMWKTQAMDKVTGYLKNNWQYLVPAAAGAGLLTWGMLGNRGRQKPLEEYAEQRPAWYENVNWRGNA